MSDERRPITVDDLYELVNVEEPRVSPDGAWIACVRVQPDRFENGYRRHIWLVPVAGGEPVQVTRGGKESTPRWSPDGRMLAFVSAREGKPQVYLLPVAAPGGEARALTNMPNGATSPEWSPDGTRIACLSALNAEERAHEDAVRRGDVADEPPADKLDAKQRQERREEDDKTRLDPYPMTKIPYRAGTSFVGDRRAQVYVMAVAEGLTGDEAKPRRLTDIDVDHQPPVWSPDGEAIYTGRMVDPQADEPFLQNAIYRITVADGSSEQVTGEDFSSFAPLPSPDGRWLAFIRSERPNVFEAMTRLSVMPVGGGEVRDLNLTLDRAVTTFDWTPDSAALVFSAGDQGVGPLYQVDAGSGQVETLLRGEFLTAALHVGPDGGVAYTASTPDCPPELAYLTPGAASFQRVTSFNAAFLEGVVVQPTHELRFTNPDGREIQGWYMLPVGYEDGQQVPLAVNIHGGPHVMWSPSTPSMFHEWQLHAARGYAVFYCNPRGGDGYGEAFQRSLHAAWGEVAFVDIMAGVDALLAKGFVDAGRMAVTGGSYGGYMTAWVVGHTDRFACAVTQRGVYNLSSFYGTSDIPSLISREFDAEPWEQPELLWKHSPLAYAHNIKTPLLIIHAENDYRVPIEQAEQLFAFVRRSGGTVEMLRYPRDGHELSRSGEPKHRASRLEQMVGWFDRYCK